MSRVLTILLCAVLASTAQGALVTFEDVTPDSFDVIPDGYHGLVWSNLWVIDPQADDNELPPANGYRNGLVSGRYVGYNAFGNPAEIFGACFDFTSAWLTGAWYNDLQVQVDGYLGDVLQYSLTVIVQATGPQLFTFDYRGIDRLVLTSSEGMDAGYDGGGQMFVMDNPVVLLDDAHGVPAPAAFWLGMGLMGAVVALRLRRITRRDRAEVFVRE